MSQHLKVIASTLFLGLGCLISPAQAQIRPDGSVNTIVAPAANIFTIEGGTTAGNNLFHSFSEFSVPSGNEAFFKNANTITNIFSRVTGGQRSDIQGRLRANGTANLFLLNPAGVIFGENASLNLGGSFFATTADSLLFANDIIFSAIDPSPPALLSVNTPIGLQLGEAPAPIQVRGTGHNLALDLDTVLPIRENRPVGLQVNAGQTLALIGGDIRLTGGNLTAHQGRIELGSVAQAGRIDLSSAPGGFTFDYGDLATFGTLSLTQAASVDVSGAGSGHLQLQASQIQVLGASAVISNVTGTQNGGSVVVRASDSVEVIGTETGDFPSAFFNNSEPNSTGNAGLLSIETGTLRVANNAFLSSNIAGSGHGGGLSITTNAIEISNSTQVPTDYFTGLFSQVLAGSTGQGGDVTIHTQQASFRDGSHIEVTTNDAGNAGDLTIQATTLEAVGANFEGTALTFISVDTFSSGQGGDLTLETDRLSVREGAQFAAGSFGSGSGGNFTITANTIDVTGEFVDSQGFSLPSGLFVDALASGQGGNLSIATDHLSVSGGGSVAAGTLSEGNSGDLSITANTIEVTGVSPTLFASVISVGTFSAGQSGSLVIETGSLSLTDGGNIAASSFDTGDGGNITVSASERIEIIGKNAAGNNFSILTSATDSTVENAGNAGNVILNTPHLLVADGGSISAATFSSGNGGNIEIQADTIEVRDAALDFAGALNGIVTFVAPQTLDFDGNAGPPATGDGGSITIQANQLLLTDGGQIDASTFGDGSAGNINLNVNEITLAGRSEILEDGMRIPSRITSVSDTDFAAGAINIRAETLQIRDRALIAVDAINADAGDIMITTSQDLSLNQGTITATAAQGNGGNLSLNVGETLLLRDNSEISTTAGRAGAGGNGGNISLNAPLIVSFALENSDITANAFEGNGGNINIDAEGILGITFRSGLTADSDITASSQFGVDGTVNIETPNVDPEQGLVTLPSALIDSSRQIAEACEMNPGNFVVVGRGGLPLDLRQPLQGRLIWHDQRGWTGHQVRLPSVPIAAASETTKGPLLEAQGWQRDALGQMRLVAQPGGHAFGVVACLGMR